MRSSGSDKASITAPFGPEGKIFSVLCSSRLLKMAGDKKDFNTSMLWGCRIVDSKVDVGRLAIRLSEIRIASRYLVVC